ncbi:MAG: hypothetical protein MJY82_09140 [Fibrobacter sp.]|nr:hypothetical protein [Fibrobacter sp.]
MNLLKTSLLFLPLLAFVACTDYASKYDNDTASERYKITLNKHGKFTDERDGEEYGVVKMGQSYWMSENLRYVDSSKTKNLKGGVWCFENKKDNCKKFGMLYSWRAAMDYDSAEVDKKNDGYNNGYWNTTYNHQGVCPEHWHIPSRTEWSNMRAFASVSGGKLGDGINLKTYDYWEPEGDASVGVNRFGFNAMPAGRRNMEDGGFMNANKYAFFWSDEDIDEETAHGWTFRYDNDALQEGAFYKEHGMSVRCVLDEQSIQKLDGDLDSTFLDSIHFDYGSLEIDGKKYKTIEIFGMTWMAENANVKLDSSWCYAKKSENCDKYGRLYSYSAAQKVCPEGWRLPDMVDFKQLTGYVIGMSALRSRNGWTDRVGKGWNLWGFNAKPAGGFEAGDFFDISITSYMWGSEKMAYIIKYSSESPEYRNVDSKTAYSVRCIKE